MGFFPTDAIDGDEIGPNSNGSYFKYVAADDKWILIPNADVYTEAEVDALLHAEAHSIASHNDTTATGAELETLTDGSETDLHSHAGGGRQYVDRGDPAAADYVTANFTKDTAYHDLDLSGIVPAGAVAIHIQGSIKDAVVGQFIIFRKNGNVNDGNVVLERTQVVNAYHEYDSIVACDVNRVIEYKISAGMDFVNLTVRGWWI